MILSSKGAWGIRGDLREFYALGGWRFRNRGGFLEDDGMVVFGNPWIDVGQYLDRIALTGSVGLTDTWSHSMELQGEATR